MLTVVSNIQDEVDIIECWVEHYLAEGVDLILTTDQHSRDGTREILDRYAQETGKVEWIDDPEDIHYQPARMSQMAELAGERGATWVIPADADEFWCATSGRTLAEELADCPHEKVYAPVYHHVTWDVRLEALKLAKVAFRCRPGLQLTMGNHEVNISGGTYGVLEARELQYRGFDHFCAKVAARARTLDPSFVALGNGAHIVRLVGLGRDEMLREWDAMIGAPKVRDPIPTRTTLRPREYVR